MNQTNITLIFFKVSVVSIPPLLTTTTLSIILNTAFTKTTTSFLIFSSRPHSQFLVLTSPVACVIVESFLLPPAFMIISSATDVIPALTLVSSTNLLIPQALITLRLDNYGTPNPHPLLSTSLYILSFGQFSCFYMHRRISVTPYSNETIMI